MVVASSRAMCGVVVVWSSGSLVPVVLERPGLGACRRIGCLACRAVRLGAQKGTRVFVVGEICKSVSTLCVCSGFRCGHRCPIWACSRVCCKLALRLVALGEPETCPASTSSARVDLGPACSALLSIGGQFGWSAGLALDPYRWRHSQRNAGRRSAPCFLLDVCLIVELFLVGASGCPGFSFPG